VDKYSLTLTRHFNDGTTDTCEELVAVRGGASTCRAVLAEIASELGASGLSMTLGYSDTASAGDQDRNRYTPDVAPETSTPPGPVSDDDGRPKRTRRTKAQIEADRLAAEQPVAVAALEPAPQPVDVPAPLATGGGVTGSVMPPEMTTPILATPDVPPAPYNPFNLPAK
jgi:hypothetical protein